MPQEMTSSRLVLFTLLLSLSSASLECVPASNQPTAKCASKSCPHGWVRYGTEKCIRVFEEKITQNEAEMQCNDLGATLNSIHSYHELAFVNSYLLKTIPKERLTHFAIGLKRVGNIWFWLDLSPLDYTDWYQSEPLSTHANDCGSLTSASWKIDKPQQFGKMNNEWPCDMKIPFICQVYFADLLN